MTADYLNTYRIGIWFNLVFCVSLEILISKVWGHLLHITQSAYLLFYLLTYRLLYACGLMLLILTSKHIHNSKRSNKHDRRHARMLQHFDLLQFSGRIKAKLTPHTLTVREGETASLVCRISGRPVDEIRWFKDRQLLTLTENISSVAVRYHAWHSVFIYVRHICVGLWDVSMANSWTIVSLN